MFRGFRVGFGTKSLWNGDVAGTYATVVTGAIGLAVRTCYRILGSIVIVLNFLPFLMLIREARVIEIKSSFRSVVVV